MEWYIRVLKHYAVFEGRARRKEYWFFILLNFIIGTAFLLIDHQLGTYDYETQAGFLNGLYALLVLLPTIAVAARRLHDTDRSGWWLMLSFIPIIGLLVLLFFFCSRGDHGSNRFGTDPLANDHEMN